MQLRIFIANWLLIEAPQLIKEHLKAKTSFHVATHLLHWVAPLHLSQEPMLRNKIKKTTKPLHGAEGSAGFASIFFRFEEKQKQTGSVSLPFRLF